MPDRQNEMKINVTFDQFVNGNGAERGDCTLLFLTRSCDSSETSLLLEKAADINICDNVAMDFVS